MIDNPSEKSELGPEDGMYVKQKKAIWEERKYFYKKAPRQSWSGTLKRTTMKGYNQNELNGA